MSLRRVFSSSVGTKVLIGATGLLLFLFLVLHLAGNLMVFAGQNTFNQYSHTLISWKAIRSSSRLKSRCLLRFPAARLQDDDELDAEPTRAAGAV